MNLSRKPEIVVHYQRLRAASRVLSSKVRDATRSLEFDFLKAARKMTLPVQGRTLIFDDETETAAFMDFYLHEFRKGGRRLLDCCDPVAMGLSTDERDLLEAHRLAGTSLFEVVSVNSNIAQVRLSNLLSPDQPEVLLSDISMSKSSAAVGRALLFLRIVACQGIEMTSGSLFTFSSVHRERLLEEYARRMETVPPGERSQRRSIFFYQRFREFGAGQAFDTPE